MEGDVAAPPLVMPRPPHVGNWTASREKEEERITIRTEAPRVRNEDKQGGKLSKTQRVEMQ